MDGASASGSLCRLCFRIRYLAMGGGHIAGHDGEASDWMGGTTMNRGLARMSFTAVMFITKLICLWVQGRAYIRNHEQGNVCKQGMCTDPLGPHVCG